MINTDKNKIDKETRPYHHGDLKRCLIEAGIELINDEGEKNFSLRKVAAKCDVSHAAPYSHFKNKDDMINAMQNYVTELFMEKLNDAVNSALAANLGYEKAVLQLGKSYIMFFVDNPQYFRFLFSQPCMKINLNMDDDGSSNYAPFELFRKNIFKALENYNMNDEQKKDAVISSWALVHGVASIATMKNVVYDKLWEDKIYDLIERK